MISRDDIVAAADRIASHVRLTPLLALGDALDSGYNLSLKLDNHQPTGSFKVRGAFSALTAVDDLDRPVVAASGGNFGFAVAYAASRLGRKATIFVPEDSPGEKTDLISSLGAELRRVPGFYADALEAAERWVRESGSTGVHAYDQAEVMAGQGTCGREIAQQAHRVDSLLVAVGGGGLIGGIATWFQDDSQIVAVESEGCPTFYEARKAGRPVDVEVGGVAVSSLGAGRIGDLPWQASRWIDDSLLVEESSIHDAQEWLWNTARVLAEPSAATTIAALLTGVYRPARGEEVIAVISGANTRVDF